MARNRRSKEEDSDFDFDDSTDTTPQAEPHHAESDDVPFVQPATPVSKAATANGKEILASLFGISMDDVSALVKAKEDAAVFAMAAQAQEYATRMKSETEQKEIREWASRSSQERTQDVVNHNWGAERDAQKYRVRLVKNKNAQGKPESITLTIPAHSIEEAQGRYLRVCGIRTTEHFVRAEPIKQELVGSPE